MLAPNFETTLIQDYPVMNVLAIQMVLAHVKCRKLGRMFMFDLSLCTICPNLKVIPTACCFLGKQALIKCKCTPIHELSLAGEMARIPTRWEATSFSRNK